MGDAVIDQPDAMARDKKALPLFRQIVFRWGSREFMLAV
jgi:hypothetical protein